MNNCKTCVYRLFDPIWTVYKCRLKKETIRDVDTLDCEEYKKGDPDKCAAEKEPIITPSKPVKPQISSTPGSCTSCMYYRFDPIWITHKCLLKKIELQNGILTDCDVYKKGKPSDYTEPKEAKLDPPVYKIITENGIHKASDDGVIGYNEVDVQVPVKDSLDEYPEYKGKYTIAPETKTDVVLSTSKKRLESNIIVKKIPYAEVSNNSGGTTASIGEV